MGHSGAGISSAYDLDTVSKQKTSFGGEHGFLSVSRGRRAFIELIDDYGLFGRRAKNRIK